MKKFLSLCSLAFLLCFNVHAAPEPTYIEEVEGLGYVAGEGLACEASKYDTYEMIARSFLISKASSDEEQAKAMDAYNEAKANAFIAKIKDGMAGCAAIAENFDRQRIFKSVIYGDGTIKMPDGKIITPRQAYDVTLVYKKDPEMREKMINLYRQTRQKILNDPEFQKALRERQMQDGF